VELKLDIAAGAGNVDLRYREEAKDIFSPGSWISLFESLKFERKEAKRGAKVVPLTDVKSKTNK